MTVIAYKNGVVAADTSAWHGDVRIASDNKIIHLPGPFLFAAMGREDFIEACVNWLTGGVRPEPLSDDDNFQALVVGPFGARFVSYRTFEMIGPPRDMIALGAHNDFLYGAMLAGASAEEAVRLAIKHCAFAGGDVQVERLA